MAFVEVDHLFFRYDNLEVLHDVNITLAKGELVAMVGQNGAGKTTLAKHFNGLLKPSQGAVRIAGRDTRSVPISELARHVGYCYQNPDHQIFSATVREELIYGPRQLGIPQDKIDWLVSQIAPLMGIDQFLHVYPYTLSKGIRQKIAVASVLMSEATVLVVDEPTTGLDWRDSSAIMRMFVTLAEQGHTVCVITHDMRVVAEFVSRTIVMRQGHVIADGLTREVFADEPLLSSAFVLPPQITRIGHRISDAARPTWLNVLEGTTWIRQNVKEG